MLLGNDGCSDLRGLIDERVRGQVLLGHWLFLLVGVGGQRGVLFSMLMDLPVKRDQIALLRQWGKLDGLIDL